MSIKRIMTCGSRREIEAASRLCIFLISTMVLFRCGVREPAIDVQIGRSANGKYPLIIGAISLPESAVTWQFRFVVMPDFPAQRQEREHNDIQFIVRYGASHDGARVWYVVEVLRHGAVVAYQADVRAASVQRQSDLQGNNN